MFKRILLAYDGSEPGQKALQEADALALADPVAAYLLIERLPTVYKETEVAAKASKVTAELKKSKAVAKELQARPYLAAVKKIDTELTGKPGSFDPKLERFRKDSALLLNQLEMTVRQMKTAYPAAKATEQAVRIGDRYGLGVR